MIGNKVLVNLGAKQAGLLAVDLSSGKTIWNQTDENASYSSPTIYDRNGSPEALFVTRYNLMLVQPSDGKTSILTPFGKRGPTVNAATPLVVGKDHVFLTASYGIGAAYGKIAKDKFEILWTNDDTLSSQYVTPVEVAGVLYGIHGREDAGAGELRGRSEVRASPLVAREFRHRPSFASRGPNSPAEDFRRACSVCRRSQAVSAAGNLASRAGNNAGHPRLLRGKALVSHDLRSWRRTCLAGTSLTGGNRKPDEVERLLGRSRLHDIRMASERNSFVREPAAEANCKSSSVLVVIPDAVATFSASGHGPTASV